MLVPVGRAPHRELDGDPGADVRLALCEAAVAGDPRFRVSSAEIDRSGRSYTVETLRALGGGGDDIVLILGADQASALPSWHEPEEVLRLARVAVASREGLERESVVRRLHSLKGAEDIQFFDMPRIDISSTLVRARAASGRPIRYLVPDKVASAIESRGLYGASAPTGAVAG